MPKGKPAAANRIPLIQVRYILDEFDGQVETQPLGWRNGKNPNPVEFLYRKNHLLVRDHDVRRLRAAGLKVKDVRYPIPGLAVAEDNSRAGEPARLGGIPRQALRPRLRDSGSHAAHQRCLPTRNPLSGNGT